MKSTDATDPSERRRFPGNAQYFINHPHSQGWPRSMCSSVCLELALCPYLKAACCTLTYLHGVHRNGQGRVVPIHLVLFPGVLIPQSSLVRSPDPEHSQDDHENQEANTYHNHNSCCTGNNYETKNKKIILNLKQQLGREEYPLSRSKAAT